MANFPPKIITHSQKVCNLYKRAMRQIEAYYVQRSLVRYHQVLLRHQFDKNKCERSRKEQRRLLRVGEQELFNTKTPCPVAKFPTSTGIAGGVAYGRVVTPPDWILDYWHPLEKAQYPEYFKRRESAKTEYIKHWQDGTMY